MSSLVVVCLSLLLVGTGLIVLWLLCEGCSPYLWCHSLCQEVMIERLALDNLIGMVKTRHLSLIETELTNIVVYSSENTRLRQCQLCFSLRSLTCEWLSFRNECYHVDCFASLILVKFTVDRVLLLYLLDVFYDNRDIIGLITSNLFRLMLIVQSKKKRKIFDKRAISY